MSWTNIGHTHTCLLESSKSELENSARHSGTVRGAQCRVETVGRIIETSHVALVVSMLLCDDEATLQRFRFAR